MLDIDIDRLKKTLYNNDIHYDSITYDELYDNNFY